MRILEEKTTGKIHLVELHKEDDTAYYGKEKGDVIEGIRVFHKEVFIQVEIKRCSHCRQMKEVVGSIGWWCHSCMVKLQEALQQVKDGKIQAVEEFIMEAKFK